MNEEEQAPPQQEAAFSSVGPEPVAAPEISRRVGSILDAVEREAARLREEARVEAAGYLDNARRRADGLVAERQRRIGELSDELIAKSEAVIARLDDAAPVRQGFENLVRALGDAAERLAHEAEGSAGDFEPPPFTAGTTQPAPDPYQPAPGQAAYAPPQRQPSPYPRPPAPPHSPYESYEGSPGPARGYSGGQAYGAEPSPQAPIPAQPAQPAQPAPGAHPARTPSEPAWQGAGAQAQSPAADPGDGGWRQQDDARMVAIQMAASGATRGGVREHLHRALGLSDTASVLDEVFGPGTGEDARVPWTSERR